MTVAPAAAAAPAGAGPRAAPVSGAPARPRDLAALLASAVVGLAVVWAAGHAQAGALHDAAHDVRHATGFPCH